MCHSVSAGKLLEKLNAASQEKELVFLLQTQWKIIQKYEYEMLRAFLSVYMQKWCKLCQNLQIKSNLLLLTKSA